MSSPPPPSSSAVQSALSENHTQAMNAFAPDGPDEVHSREIFAMVVRISAQMTALQAQKQHQSHTSDISFELKRREDRDRAASLGIPGMLNLLRDVESAPSKRCPPINPESHYQTWESHLDPPQVLGLEMDRERGQNNRLKVSMQRENSCLIEKVYWTWGRLIITFITQADALRAVVNSMKVNGGVYTVVPFEPKSVPLYCHRCFKPGHMKLGCKNKRACGRCAKDHDFTDCHARARCINCGRGHPAWSIKCEYTRSVSMRANCRGFGMTGPAWAADWSAHGFGVRATAPDASSPGSGEDQRGPSNGKTRVASQSPRRPVPRKSKRTRNEKEPAPRAQLEASTITSYYTAEARPGERRQSARLRGKRGGHN
ncbi:hypothetical protein B0T10DRAFT_461624 [Thelonectria olida]|uniref:Gag-like protein n=1 Tax=Thelonectria olida TaxID=1576542 RepID=A0A9P9AMB2_9HYPO|nr:hypothetical protein B0T10DRAFT_461624 [Thelonectria olida]